jgi:hypothetical protein
MQRLLMPYFCTPEQQASRSPLFDGYFVSSSLLGSHTFFVSFIQATAALGEGVRVLCVRFDQLADPADFFHICTIAVSSLLSNTYAT